MNVAVLGASDNPERYSYKALKLLQEKGHTVVPIHPRIKTIEGIDVVSSLKDISQPIDTLSMYVNADVSSQMTEDILAAKPRRIIFNPGSENNTLKEKAQTQKIECIEACTLVLLKTNQF